MVDTTEFNLVPNNEEEEFTVDFGEVTRLAGSSDFNQLQNRPQYDGQVMTGETDIPKVPTATSELNNDSDYQTGSEVQQTINAAIANKQDKLTAGQNITISEQNVISATGITGVDWGDIGGNLNDQIDLKDVLDAKQDTLTPGDNVTITNNTISATDTKYTAGNGLSLNGTQFSADTAVLQEKLDAGNAITIENNTINADIYPADFFINEATDTDTGSNITLDKTIPATLKSVELYGDTSQTTYTGKNLFSIDFSYQPVLPPSETNTFTLDRDTTRYTRFDFPVVLPAGTYTISFDISDNNTGSGVSFNLFNQSETSIVLVPNIARGVETYHYSGTFTVGESIKIFRCFIAENEVSGSHATLSNVQIETGSTATSYEPYVGGIPAPNPDYPQDVNVVTGEQTVTVNGKNLWGGFANSYSRTNASVDFTTNIDGSITASGTSSQALAFSINNSLAETNNIFVTLKQGTYTISSDYTGNLRIEAMRVSDNTALARIVDNSATFTIDEDTDVFVRLGVLNGTSIDRILRIQIEAGSTATDYEPYQSQTYTVDLGSTELCKIGDYQDYIYKSGDDWYVHKEIGKVVLDGSNDETWGISNTGTPNFFYRYQYLTNAKTPADGSLSNIERQTGINSSNTSQGFDYTSNGELRIRYGTQKTVPEWRSFLSTTPMVLYYPLTTPTDTQITDAGLIADLNALAGAKSYLDVTNFTVTATGTNLPALLKPEVYTKSLNGVLESAHDAATVSQINATIDAINSALGSSIPHIGA